jgi:hypothetical protein
MNNKVVVNKESYVELGRLKQGDVFQYNTTGFPDAYIAVSVLSLSAKLQQVNLETGVLSDIHAKACVTRLKEGTSVTLTVGVK